jgi:hypothetical protein
MIQIVLQAAYHYWTTWRTNLIMEVNFGEMLSVIPGNQTYFTIEISLAILLYEFVSDEYITLQWNHNF